MNIWRLCKCMLVEVFNCEQTRFLPLIILRELCVGLG
jgi:hypothetical protein